MVRLVLVFEGRLVYLCLIIFVIRQKGAATGEGKGEAEGSSYKIMNMGGSKVFTH